MEIEGLGLELKAELARTGDPLCAVKARIGMLLGEAHSK
jgi:hypothetical protein